MKAKTLNVKIINRPSRESLIAALLLARSVYVSEKIKSSLGPTDISSVTQGSAVKAARPSF